MEFPAAVLVGAGLSTSSGIPDYRGGDGLWKRFEPRQFTIERFRADPQRFWELRVALVRESRILEAEPNEAHFILRDAVRDGQVSTIITQNIDGLHHKAGTPPDAVIEVHGNAGRCRCMMCDKRQDMQDILAAYDGSAPRCRCGGVFKPDVVLFGEEVTELPHARAAVQAAASLVTVGTSLQVWPVAGLVQSAVDQGKDVAIVNRDPTPFDDIATRVVRADVAEGLRTLFR